jgi:dienelactone hydrolase
MPRIPVKLSRAIGCILSLLALLSSAPLVAGQRSPSRPEKVTIPLAHLPFDLKGDLRRPDGGGPFPAVILLPACGAFMNSVDEGWAETLTSWGYIALTLDVFSPRGIQGGRTCLYPAPPETAEDVYRALDSLAARKDVDRSRIILVGFGRGGSVALSAVERGGTEARATRRFRGAAAFYPACGAEKGVMTIPTLIVVGALDTRALEACRKMAQGKDDVGISRQSGDGIPIEFVALPEAYAGFDTPAFQKPIDVRGFHLEFSQSATDQSRNVLREFLQSLR